VLFQIIAHRLRTIMNADKIVVLKEGKVVEQGSHEKLMKEKGLYSHLASVQQKGQVSV
jgi:ABC-type transport system involved in Fe-S cluster assembly fused permease/ATPase subunit